MKDGDIYEGEWVEGKRKGEGKLITKEGKIYLQVNILFFFIKKIFSFKIWNEIEEFDASNKGDTSKLYNIEVLSNISNDKVHKKIYEQNEEVNNKRQKLLK